MAHGWTGAYCRYLDYLVTVDITYVAPHHERHRYESIITMKCSDPDLQLGPMEDSDDYQATTRLLVNIRREQGRVNTYIPKMQRTRRIPKCSARNNRIPMWVLERHRDQHDHFQTTGRLQVCEGLALRSSRVKHLEKCNLGRSIQYLMVRV